MLHLWLNELPKWTNLCNQHSNPKETIITCSISSPFLSPFRSCKVLKKNRELECTQHIQRILKNFVPGPSDKLYTNKCSPRRGNPEPRFPQPMSSSTSVPTNGSVSTIDPRTCTKESSFRSQYSWRYLKDDSFSCTILQAIPYVMSWSWAIHPSRGKIAHHWPKLLA